MGMGLCSLWKSLEIRYVYLIQVLVNAGQANAATGDAGYQDCLKSAEAVAQELGIETDQVLIESTGLAAHDMTVLFTSASIGVI